MATQRRTMTLTAMEFLRRFVQHILPRGFVRIRQCGLSRQHVSRSSSWRSHGRLLATTVGSSHIHGRDRDLDHRDRDPRLVGVSAMRHSR